MIGLFGCGHSKTPDNSRFVSHGERRYARCRTCHNARNAAYKAARRAREKAARADGADARPTVPERVRLPTAPLLAFARGRMLSTDQDMAVRRAKKAGDLTLLAADKVACALGTHPALIWPEWWEMETA